MLHYLDTSAVLNGGLRIFDNIYISPLVIQELEHIKTSSYADEKTKYLARQAVRDILASKDINTYPLISQRQVNKIIKKYDFLSDINDHKMICEALLLSNEEHVKFVTSDGAQLLFAREFPIYYLFLDPKEEPQERVEYCGWSKHYPNEEQMAALYSSPKINTLNIKINEFAEIFEGNELKDVLTWDGERYRTLNYHDFKSVLGDKIRPRNLEQKMYLDLLQNKNIPIKLCTARFGTGKSYLALSYALHEIQQGHFDKIVFVKNNLEVKGAGKLGKRSCPLA